MKISGINHGIARIVVCCILCSQAYGAYAKENILSELNAGLIKVSQRVLPTVVSISALREHASGDAFQYNTPFDIPRERQVRPRAMGSGVIIDQRGYIVTNNHVIKNTEQISVTLYNKNAYPCTVVGVDPATDLAVIKIKGTVPANLPVIKMADSNTIQVGQISIAIGNAFGFSHTVTMGIVSAIGRKGVGLAEYENFIQTDTAINPGNSGGALVDIEGKLIGINTAIYSKSGGNMGLGFAIPSNMVQSIVTQLIAKGKVIRGWLGVYIQDVTEDIAEKMHLKSNKGVIVSDVMKESPAQKAGLHTGDVIIAVNKDTIHNVYDLRKSIAEKKPGESIHLTVIRKGKKAEFVIRVSIMPKKHRIAQKKIKDSPLGLQVENMSEQLAYQFNIRDKSGVIIVRLKQDSPAGVAGLRVGDLIKEIDNRPVENKKDFTTIIQESINNKKLLFLIRRNNAQRYIVVHISP